MKALIVVDMVNDLVLGGSAEANRARDIIPAIKRMIDNARADDDWLLVYCSDAHRADDRELSLCDRHAMAGTSGAQIVEQLAPQGLEREVVIGKRWYGGFDGTELEDVLLDYDVSEVVLAGTRMESAIRHTAYGAYLAGFDVLVPVDAVCAGDGVDRDAVLAELKSLYGAVPTTSAALTGRPVLRTAASNPLLGRTPRR